MMDWKSLLRAFVYTAAIWLTVVIVGYCIWWLDKHFLLGYFLFVLIFLLWVWGFYFLIADREKYSDIDEDK